MLPKTDQKIHSGIYAIICRENGVSYPGRAQDILDRYKIHLRHLKKKDHHCEDLQCTFNKYGENSLFLIIIEDDIPHNQLKIREQIYLDFARENKKLFFNSSYSSDGPEMTPKIIEKIRQKAIGRKQHSEEFKSKMSKLHTGKTISEKSKEKNRKTWENKMKNGYIHPNKNKPLKEDFKKYLSEKAKLRDHSFLNKKVKQINKNTGETINIFNSIKEASKSLNVKSINPSSHISEACLGKIKSAYGFKWEYV